MMKSATKQSYGEVSQNEVTLEESGYWLRLLGDRNQVDSSAGLGQNGHQISVSTVRGAVILDDRSAYWLRLLGGTGQTKHTTNNGAVAKMGRSASGQQFTPEPWLRLLGNPR